MSESNGEHARQPALAACPFCGAGTTRLDESTHWTGVRSVVVAARVMHWCARIQGHPQSLIQIAGRDAAAAAAAWNTRADARLQVPVSAERRGADIETDGEATC